MPDLIQSPNLFPGDGEILSRFIKHTLQDQRVDTQRAEVGQLLAQSYRD